jgi:GT2 family glycosyltransferase
MITHGMASESSQTSAWSGLVPRRILGLIFGACPSRTARSAVTTPEAAPVDWAEQQAGPLRLTVIICAYTLDRWQAILAAVASLRGQTRTPDELILVSDHNPELLARAAQQFPDVVCIPNEEAQGLSGARNTGVRRATGDVVAFLDDDAAAAPDWAERLLESYADPSVIGVGGGVDPAWQAPRPSWFPDEFLWVVGCSYAGQPGVRSEARNPIGANMSFRRAVFTQVGGFDSTMGRLGEDASGCEETEFAIRAHRLRPETRIVLDPAARCSHLVTDERVTRRYFRRRCVAEGRSKALLSRLAGAGPALSSERAYLRRTIPAGVARGLGDLARGDVTGAGRAAALVEGVVLTAGSYLLTLVRSPSSPRA